MDDGYGVNCTSLVFHLTRNSAIYDALENIAQVYDQFFVYVLQYGGPVFVLANMFVIFILTRKELRTPYNIVFIAMALNQGLTILWRDLITWMPYFPFSCSLALTLPWQLFEMFALNLCPVFIAHVPWLAVIITFVRLRQLSSKSPEPSMRYMMALCCSSFALILSTSAPLFLSTEIVWLMMYTNCENRKWHELVPHMVPFVVESDNLFANDCLMVRITYFSSGVMCNALPCILLVLLSSILIFRLQKIYKKHRALVAGSSSAAKADSTRTTLMIAMIVVTTLITDVPQAVVNILVGFMTDSFRTSKEEVGFRLGYLCVTLVMVASASNLAIHLCMSRQFREVTKRYLFCACGKAKSNRSTVRVTSSIRSTPSMTKA